MSGEGEVQRLLDALEGEVRRLREGALPADAGVRLRALELSVLSLSGSLDRLATVIVQAGQAQRVLAGQVEGIVEVVGQIRAIVEGAR